jgi:hypothetical protein
MYSSRENKRKYLLKMHLSSKLMVRYYSTPSKIWVKLNGGPSSQVPISGCTNIDDFAKKVQKEFMINSQVTLFGSLDKKSLRPGLQIKDFFKTDDFKNNTDESPLFAKIIPISKDEIASKIIYVRDIDGECRPLDSFTDVLIESDADVKEIYEGKGSALYQITQPKSRVTKLKQLKHGEKYDVYSRYEQSYQQEHRWQQSEDMAMEEEVALALKDCFHFRFGSTLLNMPRKIYGTDGEVAQEWDAVFKVGDVLYLCEAKHVMSCAKVANIPQRIKLFKEQLQPHAPKDFSIGVNQVVGVVCGTYFPPLVQEKARELGLICVYPSGWRYQVDKFVPYDYQMKI